MEQNCREQILDDVVRVLLVPASSCVMSIPFSVAGLTSMAGTRPISGANVDRIGAAVLSVGLVPDTDGYTDDGEMGTPPSLRQSESRQSAGVVVQHELTILIIDGFETVREKVNTLRDTDFNVILLTDDGRRYLLYGVPNGSEVLLDETDVNHDSTLKVGVQSMSHVIRLF